MSRPHAKRGPSPWAWILLHRPLARRRQIIAPRHGRRAWDASFLICDVHNGHGTTVFETFAFECVEHGAAMRPGATFLYGSRFFLEVLRDLFERCFGGHRRLLLKALFRAHLKLKANCLSCVGYLDSPWTFLRRWRLPFAYYRRKTRPRDSALAHSHRFSSSNPALTPAHYTAPRVTVQICDAATQLTVRLRRAGGNCVRGIDAAAAR